MRYGLPSRMMGSGSLWRLATSLVNGPDSRVLTFANQGFSTLPADQNIEEEAHDSVSTRRYYPAYIGEIIENKYQIAGKLGYGLGSTIWLANRIQ